MFEEQRPLRLIDQKRQRTDKKAEKRGQRGVVFKQVSGEQESSKAAQLANSMRYRGECPD